MSVDAQREAQRFEHTVNDATVAQRRAKGRSLARRGWCTPSCVVQVNCRRWRQCSSQGEPTGRNHRWQSLVLCFAGLCLLVPLQGW